MTRPPKRISSRVVVGMVVFGPFRVWMILYRVGIFTAAKMPHLSDDKTVAKMGHPAVVVGSDVGHPSHRRSDAPPRPHPGIVTPRRTLRLGRIISFPLQWVCVYGI